MSIAKIDAEIAELRQKLENSEKEFAKKILKARKLYQEIHLELGNAWGKRLIGWNPRDLKTREIAASERVNERFAELAKKFHLLESLAYSDLNIGDDSEIIRQKQKQTKKEIAEKARKHNERLHKKHREKRKKELEWELDIIRRQENGEKFL